MEVLRQSTSLDEINPLQLTPVTQARLVSNDSLGYGILVRYHVLRPLHRAADPSPNTKKSVYEHEPQVTLHTSGYGE